MINIEYAKDPKQNEDGSVDILVKFTHLEEEVQFTASREDVMEHGRDLFLRACRGEFGPMQMYVEPTAEEVASRENPSKRSEALKLAKEKIYHHELMLDEVKAEEWKQFYRDVFNLIKQPEWPVVVWPTQPKEE